MSYEPDVFLTEKNLRKLGLTLDQALEIQRKSEEIMRMYGPPPMHPPPKDASEENAHIQEHLKKTIRKELHKYADSEEFKDPERSNSIALIFCGESSERGNAKAAKGRFNVMIGMFARVTRAHFKSVMAVDDPIGLGTNLEIVVNDPLARRITIEALQKFMRLCELIFKTCENRKVEVGKFLRANRELASFFATIFEELDPHEEYQECKVQLRDATYWI
jgi:hypothetical protein